MKSQRGTAAREQNKTSRRTRSQENLCDFADGVAVTWLMISLWLPHEVRPVGS